MYDDRAMGVGSILTLSWCESLFLRPRQIIKVEHVVSFLSSPSSLLRHGFKQHVRAYD